MGLVVQLVLSSLSVDVMAHLSCSTTRTRTKKERTHGLLCFRYIHPAFFFICFLLSGWRVRCGDGWWVMRWIGLDQLGWEHVKTQFGLACLAISPILSFLPFFFILVALYDFHSDFFFLFQSRLFFFPSVFFWPRFYGVFFSEAILHTNPMAIKGNLLDQSPRAKVIRSKFSRPTWIDSLVVLSYPYLSRAICFYLLLFISTNWFSQVLWLKEKKGREWTSIYWDWPPSLNKGDRS